jgi:lysophospholipid acyltransferase (LPLAT)-like uncharacterized protein
VPKNEKSIQDKLSLTITDDNKLPALSKIKEKDGLLLEKILGDQSRQPEEYKIDEEEYQEFVEKRTRRQSAFFRFRRGIIYSDIFFNAFASVIAFFIKLYCKTLKIEVIYPPEHDKLENPSKVIYAFWHNRSFLFIDTFGKLNPCVMVDLSWIGELTARVIKKFGYIPARGSSKRRGTLALLEMKKIMEQGHVGAVIVDGPTGPIYKSKAGVLMLSHMTGAPIIPCVASADRAWILENTWCKYMIPKPFARCLITGANPLWESTKKGKIKREDLDKILMDLITETDKKFSKKSPA